MEGTRWDAKCKEQHEAKRPNGSTVPLREMRFWREINHFPSPAYGAWAWHVYNPQRPWVLLMSDKRDDCEKTRWVKDHSPKLRVALAGSSSSREK